jgi:lysophospholipase L1-like esterase
MTRFLNITAAAIISAISGTALAQSSTQKLTMIALGDSITTGFNAGGPLDQKKNSWAGGDNPNRLVTSHYQRLMDKFGGNVQSINLARAGAVTHELLDQIANIPAGTIPDYVTIMIGANDLCANPADWNAAVTAIHADLKTVITKLIQLNESVKVLISSVPDMVRLREVGRANNCQPKWNRWNICSALLGAERSEGEVQEFGNRYASVHDYYAALADEFPANVKYNHNTREFDFEPKHLATLDCFHPSVEGQKELSRLNWENGWFTP